MAQQIINTGEEPNDGTGEPLRSAFNAVNENFSEIYAAGPVGTNVVISGNTIAVTGTNNNLVLSGNGIGEVQVNSTITPTVNSGFNIGSPTAQFSTVYADYFVGNGALLTGVAGGGSGNSISNGDSNVVIAVQDGNVVISVDGTPNVAVFQKRNVEFTSNIIPSSTSTYDIGSNNLRFRDLFLSGETIYLGNAEFSANSTAVTVTNPSGGTFILEGPGEFRPYGNSSVAAFLPTYTGNLRSLQGNVWTTANVRASNLIANNIVFTRDLRLTGNIIGTAGVTTLTNVEVDISAATVASLTVTGSITGAGSISVDGNVTGGNIITNGNVTAVDVTASGNIVTGSGTGGNISGADVISANTISAVDVIATNQISAVGNVIADYFIGNGSQLTGLPESYSNANVASYLVTNTGNITAGAFISDQFVSGGTLTLTANTADLRLQSDSGIPVLQPDANVSLIVRTQDESSHQFEFAPDGSFLVATAVYSPLVSAANLIVNTISSDDSSAVTVDDELNVRGVLRTNQSVSAAGNIIGDYFIGNGRQLTGIVASDIGVLPHLTVSGNIVSGNINNQGLINTTDIAVAGNIIGAAAARIDGFAIGLTTAEDARFDDTIILGNLRVEGTTTVANIVANGTVSVSGQITTASVNSIGNVFAGNVSTANIVATDISAVSVSTSANITGSFFIGNGSQLTGIVSSYGDSNVEAYLPTYTGNIASLTGNLTTTANVNANNISASNLLIASRLATTGDALIGGNLIVNGNTIQVNVEELNVEDPVVGIGRGANNTPLTVDDGKSRGIQLWYYDSQESQAFVGWDTANSVLLAAANVSVNNEVVAVNNYGTFVTGNITAGTISANGNIVTGAGAGGNISGANVISANTLNATTVSATTLSTSGNVSVGDSLSVVGNVTANVYFGSADGLTFIPAGNIVGTVALAQSADTANTVTASSQANITSVGTLTSLTVSGNVAVDTDTLIVREDLNSVGIGGTPTNKLTVIDSSDAVSNVQRPAVFYSSNIAAGDRSIVSVGRDAVNQSAFGYFYNGNSSPNNAVTLGVNGVTVLSIDAANTATFAGDIQTGTILIDITNASISGLAEVQSTVITASANITAANFVTTGNVTATGNIAGNNLSIVNTVQSNTVSVTGNVAAGNVVSSADISAAGTVTSNVVTASLISSQGNITAAGNVVAVNFVGNLVGSFSAPGSNTQVLFNSNGVISADSAFVFDDVAKELTVGGNISTNSGGSLNIAGAISAVGNITVSAGNINGGNILASFIGVNGGIVATGNIETMGTVGAGGNVSGTNIISSGSVSALTTIAAIGNISGGNLLSNGLIQAVANVIAGNLETTGQLVAIGNVSGGNVSTNGTVTAAGNIVGGNVSTNGTVTAAGNIVGGNVSTNGTVTAAGNIVGGNISGTGITGTLLTASQTNITSVGTLSDLSVTGTVTGGNLSTNGFVSAVGTITAGNVITTTLSLTGNVVSAINTVNDITTTGNITANNIAAANSININGNPVATVDDATALAIALG